MDETVDDEGERSPGEGGDRWGVPRLADLGLPARMAGWEAGWEAG